MREHGFRLLGLAFALLLATAFAGFALWPLILGGWWTLLLLATVPTSASLAVAFALTQRELRSEDP